MKIIVAGLSHKTAPIEVREKYAFKEDGLKDSLNALKSLPGVLECLILSTCNRVEIYFLTTEEDGESLKRAFFQRPGFIPDEAQNLGNIIYFYKNEEAVEHICRVSAGLDSMVLGEPQIFGQIKEAYNLAVETGAAGPVFRSLFLQVFSLVKKIRASTEIGKSHLSVSHIAVGLARKVFDRLSDCNVMVVGAGEMAELTVQALRSQGAKRVFVTNRTFEKAVNLARLLNGTPIMFYELSDYLHNMDILISSISAENYVIGPEEIEKSVSLRAGRPLILIDISVPRSIPPDVASLENTYLYNIDNLRSVAEENIASRIGGAQKAEAIIKERAPRILRKLDTDRTISDIVEIRNTAEEIRRSEVEKLISAIDLPDAERSRIETFSRSMVNKILHKAIEKMREHSSYVKFK